MHPLSLLLTSLLPLALAAPQNTAQIYLHPPPLSSLSSRPALSPSQAHAVISYYLGIDRWVEFKKTGQWIYEIFRGWEEGGLLDAAEGGLVVLVESDTPEDFFPGQESSIMVPFSVPLSTYSSLLTTYSARLTAINHPNPSFISSYNSTSSSPALLSALDMATSESAQKVEKGLEMLTGYADWVEQGGATGAAVELLGLAELKGESKAAYEEAVNVLSAALSVPAITDHNSVVIVLPSSSSGSSAAQLTSTSPASGAALSSCYTTSQSCDSATSSCSGHGHCAATTRKGQTCYVCQCSKPLALAGQRTTWAGDKCEKIDISSDFALLVGSTVGLVVVAVGSVMLLWRVGEEKLPSTLFGATPGLKSN